MPAVTGCSALIARGPSARYSALAPPAGPPHAPTRTEVENGVAQAGVPASGLGTRLAILDGRGEMVGTGAVGCGHRAEPDLGVAARPSQCLEQRFLQRPAGL